MDKIKLKRSLIFSVILTCTALHCTACGGGSESTTRNTPPPLGGNTTYASPTLETVNIQGDNIVLAWNQTGEAPSGGYEIYVNDIDTGSTHQTHLLNQTISGLDVTVSHCFNIEALFLQADPDQNLLSNEVCSTPAPPPSASYSSPTLETVNIQGDNIVLAWNQTGEAPSGGYEIYVNDIDTGSTHQTHLLNQTITGLDVTVTHCFNIEALFGQADPEQNLLSNQICSTPSAPPPPVEEGVYYIQADTPSGMCGNITPDYTSIATALAASTAGDTFHLLSGLYDTYVNFPHGGTLTHPITLMYTPAGTCTSGDGLRTAIIDCINATGRNCVSANYSNIIIDGLEVRNSDENGIKVDGHVNGYLDENAHGNWGGYGERAYRVNGASNVIIRNNYIHHIDTDGVKMGHANNILVENNEIHSTGRADNTTQQGIDMVGVYNSVIRGNFVHDSVEASQQMNVGIFAKGGSENILIENNTITDIGYPYACLELGGDTEWYNTRYTPSEVNYISPTPGNTLTDDLLAVDRYNSEDNPIDNPATYDASTMAELRNAIVRGNILVDCDPAISFRNAYNPKVYNNTVINSGVGQGLLKFWGDGNHHHTNVDVSIYNNLFYNEAGSLPSLTRGYFQVKDPGGIYPSNLVGIIVKNNIFFDGNDDGSLSFDFDFNVNASDSENIISDPMIVLDLFNYSYVLEEGSPAINNGLDLRELGVVTAPFIGIQGIEREGDSTTDIGAMEYITP